MAMPMGLLHLWYFMMQEHETDDIGGIDGI
jgi:hypothetical protein